ncbi:23S rRNA (uracil(1939)-C(5))-methyltransferase RlmD [Puia sp.]|uniref:23S rRNA (uracil(1939)-C(5))-methyltransferase RlmD n=1 Tax=Puia sp. TaxID=2045100 RepID=UPI002F415930
MRKKKKAIELLDVLVEDYAAEGKSIARVDGKVIFIENAVPGDIVNIRLGKNKKDWAEGFVTAFREYSPKRVDPFCSHFGVCGGCRWQMLPYPLQLQYKQQQVEDVLQRIGKVELPAIDPILGAAESIHYRNKIEYTFSNRRFLLPRELHDPAVNPQQNVAGFHARGLFDKVVDIDICYLQQEPTNQLRKAVRDFGLERNLPFYDIRAHHGWLRNLQLRICTTGEIMANLVLGYEDEGQTRELTQRLLQQFPQLTTLLVTINPKWNDTIGDLEPRIVHGKGYVIEKLEDFRFKIGPKSFFQTNTIQGEALYRVTREFAELTGKETVYDLYCGTGSIGIFVSRQAARIVGVEVVPEAVADAKENAALNNIPHARFFAGDVVDVCNDEFFAREGRPDVIITDPPRAGMHEGLVNKILEIAAPTVVYVSCNPATQARDLRLLDAKYAVTRVQPVDMFPHTHHIENIVQLKLRV